LFIDCTGFAALLLGKTLGVAFKDCSDILLCDAALAVQVPYDTPDAPIASHTISTAQAAGWIWDIGLPHRRGTAYVYSTRHSTDDEAHDTLMRYLGAQHAHLTPRKISFRGGHRATFWKNNCVAVGWPLDFSNRSNRPPSCWSNCRQNCLRSQMPANREVMDIVSARFNDVTHYRWGRIVDFLKLHYVLTQREDSAFWRDNVDPATIPERLKNLLHLWKYQSPWFFDEFDRLEEVFPAASYQYVLYAWASHRGRTWDNAGTATQAASLISGNLAMTRQMRSQLPKNRDLMKKSRIWPAADLKREAAT